MAPRRSRHSWWWRWACSREPANLAVASATATVVVVVLSEKATIHGTLRRLDPAELRAALYFAVLALVILPILPDRSFGPWGGINPRSLWIVVLIFSGLNFAGFVARRMVGASRGVRRRRRARRIGVVDGGDPPLLATQPGRAGALPRSRDRHRGGVHRAPARVLVVSAILNPDVAIALLPLLGPPLIAGVVLVGMVALAEPLARERRAGARPRRRRGTDAIGRALGDHHGPCLPAGADGDRVRAVHLWLPRHPCLGGTARPHGHGRPDARDDPSRPGGVDPRGWRPWRSGSAC